MIAAEISVGELIHKITVLEIKLDNSPDAAKRKNIETEMAVSSATLEGSVTPSDKLAGLTGALRSVNQSLWRIEDDIRDLERAKDFGERFIELARAVYQTNDKRSALKRDINDLTGSRIVEEKLYAEY
ncbi:MAG: hypothetical protein H8E94_00630 [Alphaproteobacteria bacterium]|nr:hypothetical protein [Alphaproteobacteria bacterium]